MKNILFFSNRFDEIATYIKFHSLKIWKGFLLLFNKKKEIEIISLDYYKKWRFTGSYLIINYEFKNVSWFKIGNTKTINYNRPLIIDLKNLNSNELKLILYGSFRKKTVSIILNKEFELNSVPYRSKLSNLLTPIIDFPSFTINPDTIKVNNIHDMSLRMKKRSIISNQGIAVSIDKPTFARNNFKINTDNLKINHPNFNINDYL